MRNLNLNIFGNLVRRNLFKPNLLLLIYGQSNEGTDTAPGSEATGQVPFAGMPSYLSGMNVSNIDFMKIIVGNPTRTDWVVNNAVAWGWLNQVLYLVRQRWTNVLYAKRAVGGTTLLPGGGGTYDRTVFKAIASAGVAAANAAWGVGKYNVVILGGVCETNGLSEANADALQAAQLEFWADIRTNVIDAPIIIKQFGKYCDIDFAWGVPNVQNSQIASVAATPRAYLVTGGSDTGWELNDTGSDGDSSQDDFSHFNRPGAITLGNNFADRIFSLFGTTKIDAIKPILQSAVIASGAPSQVVLTYNKNISDSVFPFWKDFTQTGTVSSSRKVTAVAISGMTVTLTFSENFYTGETVTLTYVKKQYYESCIQDIEGNEADALTAQSVTNGSATTAPTPVLVYSSAFSPGNTDGWGGLSGGAAAVVDGIGGLNNVLEMTASGDQTPIISHNSLFVNTTQIHRVRFKAFVPILINSSAPSNDYSLGIFTAIGGAFKLGIYNYLRRNVLGGQWVDFEFTGIPTTAGAMRFDFTDLTITDKAYFRDIVVHRFT